MELYQWVAADSSWASWRPQEQIPSNPHHFHEGWDVNWALCRLGKTSTRRGICRNGFLHEWQVPEHHCHGPCLAGTEEQASAWMHTSNELNCLLETPNSIHEKASPHICEIQPRLKHPKGNSHKQQHQVWKGRIKLRLPGLGSSGGKR